jgi:hypothetical protein
LANVKQIFSPEIPWPNGTKLGRKQLCRILYKTSSYGFCQAVSEKIFLTVANQKKELLLVAMFVGQMEPYEEA